MSKFLAYKQNVLSYFDACISFAQRNGFENTVDPIQKSRKIIEENKLIILTCGEMRRGKSSLLSALLEDEDIFPVDVAVTTCLVTMAYYAPVETITVVLDDGSDDGFKKVINREQIGDYVTEQHNENNYKKAKLMLIETPNPKLKNGLTFVDTPGVGSLNPEHSQITYGFLPRADIVLFVSDATAPLTEPELGFLKQVKRYCNNFLFILTKKDMQANFEEIIQTNKDKIEEFTDIPKNKICYIPVASTMKLAYLQNGNARMLKSSNFEKFESIMWDAIHKNRADIIIMPPLGELATQLKSMEKDIHIKATAYSGNTKELEDLSRRLHQLQDDRQKLLSDSATWQAEMQREIENINFELNSMMSNFQSAASNFLEDGLKQPQYIKNPSLLLNQIVLMAANNANDISEEIFNRLCQIKYDFENKTKLSLYDNIIKAELDVDDDPNIIFSKPKPLDKIATGGRKIAMNSMGLSTAGGIIGGLGGAVLGFFVGGPVGAVAFAMQGASWGAGIGGASGMVKGTIEAVKDPGLDNVPQIRAVISKYINQTVNDWRMNSPKYIKDISYKFIKSMKESIELNKKTIDNDIAVLQNSTSLSRDKQLSEQKKIQSVKSEFSKLVTSLVELRAAKVEDDSERPTITIVPENSEKENSTSNFSHLED